MRSLRSSRPRCDADVGKPGNWRSCRRAAVVTIVTVCGSVRHHRKRHEGHVNDPDRRYHGPVVSVSRIGGNDV